MNNSILYFLLVACLSIGPFKIAFCQTKVFKSNLDSDEKIRSKRLSIKEIRRGEGIVVTAPNYDHIGQILGNIGFQYIGYQSTLSEVNMLFLNCGTSTMIPAAELRNYVKNGGILYASDLTNTAIEQAFPGIFNFTGTIGTIGDKNATILDSDLRSVLGNSLNIHFDLSGWAVLNSVSTGDVLLEADGKPLMVAVPYGEGMIFYTCFHNHKQASDKEEALLKLLLAKQVQQLVQMSFSDTAQQMGLDLAQMRRAAN